MSTIKKAHRVAIKEINAAICDGCGTCVDACMMDVIYFDEEKKKAYIKYQDDCQACFLCVRDCPAGAVTIGAID